MEVRRRTGQAWAGSSRLGGLEESIYSHTAAGRGRSWVEDVKLFRGRRGRGEVLIWRSQILLSSLRGKFRAKNRRWRQRSGTQSTHIQWLRQVWGERVQRRRGKQTRVPGRPATGWASVGWAQVRVGKSGHGSGCPMEPKLECSVSAFQTAKSI